MLKQKRTALTLLAMALVGLAILLAAGSLVAAPDGVANTNYEPDNIPQEAAQIGSLSIQSRGLIPAGDVDWAMLTVPAGTWSVDFLASEATPGRIRLSLYDQYLNFIESNDDDSNALVSRDCAVDALPGGLYYLKVEEISAIELANYSLAWDHYEDCSQRSDLAPHTWTAQGYQYPIVPNSVKGTKTVSSTLYAGKETYFDWSLIMRRHGIPPDNYYSRVWVDGYLAVEQRETPIGEGDVGGRDDWASIVPSAGWHTVYFEVDSDNDVPEWDEGNNTWEMEFYWSPINGWWAEFYNNQNLAGDPVLVRDDPDINFNWQFNSPGSGVNADYFSVRWERTVTFDNGVYLFTLLRDDGMRFYIDSVPYLDEWESVQNPTTHTIVESMNGAYDLRVEAMELTGPAQASVSWQRCYALTTATVPSSGGGIQVTPEPNCGSQYYVEGTEVTVTATLATGYSFTGWSGATSSELSPLILTMDGDKTLTANFSQECHTLTVNVSPGDGGTVSRSPNQACYPNGTQVTLTATSAIGYSFAGWSGATSSELSPLILTMDGDKTLIAHFVQACYALNVSVNPAGSGLIDIQPQPNCGNAYVAGTALTLTAMPNTGYYFSNWSGAIGGSDNPRILTMDSQKQITANFTRECYELSVNIDPWNGGSVDITPPPNCDETRYSAGTQVTLTAVPAGGFSFREWSGAIGSAINPRALTMDGNRSITAHFIRVTRNSFMSMVSFIPKTGLTCYTGPDEIDPNNQPTEVVQLLCLNNTIQGWRDDQRDHFAIDLPTAGEVVVRLSTVQNGGGVQLVLLYGSPPYEPADQDGTLQNELQVGLSSAQPGRYFIFVYSSHPNATNPMPYTLQVSFTPNS